MRLVANHPSFSTLMAFDFTEPGGTIGRSPDNHFLLGDDPTVAQIQAVVRIKNQDCSILNVSSNEIRLNDHQLAFMHEAPFVRGDVLTIGSYTLQCEVDENPAAMPATQPDPAQETQDTSDVFKDLLDGPGVLPVGLAAEASDLHPFALDSQAPRNHPDPINQLQDTRQHLSDYDKAHEQFNVALGPHDDHIFSDPTPSTLRLNDALAPQLANLIDEALSQGLASGERQENR
jgi:FHA domain-containing protein